MRLVGTAGRSGISSLVESDGAVACSARPKLDKGPLRNPNVYDHPWDLTTRERSRH
jgi:hypothetical protein